MTVIYESIPHQIHVLFWPESTPEKLGELLGEENVSVIPGGVQVRNSDGEWFTLGNGWGVSVADAGDRRIFTLAALNSGYRRV